MTILLAIISAFLSSNYQVHFLPCISLRLSFPHTGAGQSLPVMAGVFVIYRWFKDSTPESFEDVQLLKDVIEPAELKVDGVAHIATGVSERRLQAEATLCRIVEVMLLHPDKISDLIEWAARPVFCKRVLDATAKREHTSAAQGCIVHWLPNATAPVSLEGEEKHSLSLLEHAGAAGEALLSSISECARVFGQRSGDMCKNTKRRCVYISSRAVSASSMPPGPHRGCLPFEGDHALLHISERTVTNSKACSANCITKMKNSISPDFLYEASSSQNLAQRSWSATFVRGTDDFLHM
jgi:hypothetical protein